MRNAEGQGQGQGLFRIASYDKTLILLEEEIRLRLGTVSKIGKGIYSNYRIAP